MKEEKFKFPLGSLVRIKDYGHRITENRNGKPVVVDIAPEEIGKTGVVTDRMFTQGIEEYSLEKKGKTAWFNVDQLERAGI